MYEDFVTEFFGLFDGSGQDKDLTPFLREWQRKLVLKAGPNVLAAYFDWKTKIVAAAFRPFRRRFGIHLCLSSRREITIPNNSGSHSANPR